MFTVASISYDTQRRVRLAERLIETKRTIRSVSNSNGAAHVARMFEAAEKGEDFSLEVTKSRKRSMRRDYSDLERESARQQTPSEARSFASHHLFVKDESSGRELVGKDSSCQKDSVRLLQGSTGNSSGSLLSSQWAKGLSPESHLLSQHPLVQEQSWKAATEDCHDEAYDHHQVVKELQPTALPGAGRTVVENYPTMRDTSNITARRSSRPTSYLPHTPQLNRDYSRKFGEDHGAVERILASTQQQHKPRDHGAYGRPGKEHVARQARTDAWTCKTNRLKSHPSAAEKIVAATQQQHKLHSHAVYCRPSKANTEAHARLNEHVALWLNAGGVSRSNSGLKLDSRSQTGFALGSGNNLKRPGSIFPRDSPYIKSLQRNLSTSVSEADAGLPSRSARTPYLPQNDSQTVSTANGLHSAAHTSGEDIQKHSEEFPSPSPPNKDDQAASGTLETHEPALSDEDQASDKTHRRLRKDRVRHWSPRYSHYSLLLSKEQATAADGIKASRSGEPDVSSSKPITDPIPQDLWVEPRAVSVSASARVPEISFTENFLPKGSESGGNQMQRTPAGLISDLSDQFSVHHVRKRSVQEESSEMKTEALFASDKTFEKCVTEFKSKGYAVWDTHIRAAIEAHGTPAARHFWLRAMAHYAAPGDTLDWNLVNDLHKRFHDKFWRALPPYLDFDLGRLLLRHVLDVAPSSQRAAELLFPLLSREKEVEADFAAQGMAYTAVQRSRNLFANASQYLKDLWDEECDAEKVVSELRKMIQIAKMQGIELAEDLFFGTIQRLSSNRQIEEAQALFDEMAYYHQIEPSFLTRAVLVRGHARAGDWDRVSKEIEAMHNVHNLSRREPVGYSLMFNDILIEYASRRSIAQTHQFLVHALGYWGLVPTSAISTTAIQAFLVHRRFDLVREWMETVRILFPQVDTETSRFAWHVGSVWEDTNASCVEVEQACKALCYLKDASKVQASLREMVRLALARDLANKLRAAEVAETGTESKDDFSAGSPWALNHLLERAQSFARETSTDGEKRSRQSQEARALLSQVESVARLDKFFGAKGKFTHASSVPLHASSQPRNFHNRAGPAHAASLQSYVPSGLMRDLLPSLHKVEKLMQEYYSARQHEGLPISHAILKYTCQKLRKHDRRIDAMLLLKAIFDSPYVQRPTGVMFDLSIMEMWLKFAYEAKSLSHCLTVLWAVLDAGEDYVLTSKFVLLANMSYHKVRKNRFEELARSNPLKLEELRYLLEKLRRRLWFNKQISSSKKDQSRGVEYQKMRYQMRRTLVVGKQRTVKRSG